MMTTLVALIAGLFGQAAAPAPPPAAEQIAAAVLAAPEERREGATVLGFDAAGALVTLRQGTNDLICLADTPGDEAFSVACYHKDLEPYMARGRELTARGLAGEERNKLRWKEVEDGKVAMPSAPRPLYVLTGTAFDASTGRVADAYQRWVLYWPYATAETTGLSTKPAPSAPWLMDGGTAGAHIMISPPRPRP